MARPWPRMRFAALIIALVVGLCAPSQLVRADHIEIGVQAVDYCLTVANIDQFPNYTFFADIPPVGGRMRVMQGDCLRSTYKIASAHFSAVRTGTTDPTVPTPETLRSPLSFDFLTNVPQFDPRAKVVDVLRIVRVGPDILDIEPESVRYTYHDGSTETLPYRTVNQRPVPARTPLWYFWVVPLIGLLGIIVLLTLDNRGRSKRHEAEKAR